MLLTLDGRHAPRERELDGWPGYADSAPVRVGNGAAEQHQLDGYGWVIDAAWVLVHDGHHLYGETWRAVRGFADLVARRWREPDAGIWEVRDDAAPSRALQDDGLARARPGAAHRRDTHHVSARRRRRWRTARDAIAGEVRTRGFDTCQGSYTRSYGSADLDAALLVLPLLGIEDPDSPRVAGTIDAIRDELSAGGPLLYRYPPGRDGLPGTEGAFLPCSFWLVQALARTGRRAEAIELFEALLDRGTALGLFAEEMDPTTGAHLGNFPQALTHAALVSAALALRDTSDRAAEPLATAPVPAVDRGASVLVADPTALKRGRFSAGRMPCTSALDCRDKHRIWPIDACEPPHGPSASVEAVQPASSTRTHPRPRSGWSRSTRWWTMRGGTGRTT